MFTDALVKSSRSSRIVLSVVIVAILTAVAYNWILAPHTRYLHAAQRYGCVADDVARQNKIIKSKIAAQKRELEKLRYECAEVAAQLFSPAEAKKFFSGIESIGDRTNCVIYGINFLSGKTRAGVSPGDEAGISQNSAVVSFAGDYGDVIKFLSELVNHPQKVVVHSLAMTVPDRKSSQLECEAILTIYTIKDREISGNE